MKSLIILILCTLSITMFAQSYNADGSVIHMEATSANITSNDGIITSETRFTMYLPSVTLNQAVSEMTKQLQKKTNTEFIIKGQVYAVLYKDKMYMFDKVSFKKHSEMKAYLKQWMIKQLLS